jgi:hypothetical protein
MDGLAITSYELWVFEEGAIAYCKDVCGVFEEEEGIYDDVAFVVEIVRGYVRCIWFKAKCREVEVCANLVAGGQGENGVLWRSVFGDIGDLGIEFDCYIEVLERCICQFRDRDRSSFEDSVAAGQLVRLD